MSNTTDWQPSPAAAALPTQGVLRVPGNRPPAEMTGVEVLEELGCIQHLSQLGTKSSELRARRIILEAALAQAHDAQRMNPPPKVAPPFE